MTEFPRLLRSGSPEQRAMLEAAQEDAPSRSSQERLLLALGLGGAAVSVASSAQAVSSVETASSPTASAPFSAPTPGGIGETAAASGVPGLAAPLAAAAAAAPATTISTALVAKWLLVGTLSLAAVGIGAVAGRGIARNTPPWHSVDVHGNPVSVQRTLRSPETSREASASSNRTGSATPAAPTLPLPPPNNDLGASEVLPRSRPNEARLPHRTGGPQLESPVTPDSASSLQSANRPVAAEHLTVSGETALVEKAREALRHGDPAGCLSLLEVRRKGVRGGVLAPEAAILRIEALRALGQRARATQEATRFVHDYPGSPLLERIRGLLETAEP